MRILANYGCKTNGETYSVTFETMGDVAREQADAVVDELFCLAKQAIERQLNPQVESQTQAEPLDFPPTRPEQSRGKEEVTIPQPTRPERPKEVLSAAEGQSRREQNANGNGSASLTTSGKPQLKDPDAPATRKQKNLIIRLAKERGQFIENLNSLTMQEASSIIDELKAVEV